MKIRRRSFFFLQPNNMADERICKANHQWAEDRKGSTTLFQKCREWK